MGSQILHLNDSTFNETVENDSSPILVDFWAEWCMPCRALSPVIDELAQEYSGKIRFAKVNIDDCQGVPSKLNIRGIPTLVLFKEGKKVGELIGNSTKDKIRSFLDSALK